MRKEYADAFSSTCGRDRWARPSSLRRTRVRVGALTQRLSRGFRCANDSSVRSLLPWRSGMAGSHWSAARPDGYRTCRLGECPSESTPRLGTRPWSRRAWRSSVPHREDKQAYYECEQERCRRRGYRAASAHAGLERHGRNPRDEDHGRETGGMLFLGLPRPRACGEEKWHLLRLMCRPASGRPGPIDCPSIPD